jgi:transcriptional regulator with XRE-family HTH domain
MSAYRDVEIVTNKVADLSLNDSARGMRLSAAMSARGLMYNCQLCYDLGVTESSLSRWRSGGPMSVSMAVNLARLLGVSVDWLITGRAGSDGARRAAGQEQNEVTALFSAVSPDDRQLVLKLSSALLQQQMGEIAPHSDALTSGVL